MRQSYVPALVPMAYQLSPQLNAQIPPHIREQFKTDANGNIIWFAVPPVAQDPPKPSVTHSVQYLASKAEIEERKRKYREEKAAKEEQVQKKKHEEAVEIRKVAADALVKALDMWNPKNDDKDNGSGTAVQDDTEMSG